MPYSVGLEQVSGPPGSRRERLLVGMMGPEQGDTLLCELKPLPHSAGLFRGTVAASGTRFPPE